MNTCAQFLLSVVLAMLAVGCKKADFLAAKPDQALIVPETLDDLQAILDNTMAFNGMSSIADQGCTPFLGHAGSDDYFVGRLNIYANLPQQFKNAYVWQRDGIYAGDEVLDWHRSYLAAMYANIVLEGLQNMEMNTEDDVTAFNRIKGGACFHRAYIYYQLAQIFAPAYDRGTAAIDLGIPLRLRADVNEPITRATVKQTYDQIVADLEVAAANLPDLPMYATRPSRAAAYGLLSRVFQTMGDNEAALSHAENYLALMSELIDYNTLDTGANLPFDRFNKETAFISLMSIGGPGAPNVASVDSVLYQSYNIHDLRRKLFFQERTQRNSVGMNFRGSYASSLVYFSGIATDEIYLIKAECLARLGQEQRALDVLNELIIKRWQENEFRPLHAEGAENVLRLVLDERRKELVFRGLRWTDLKRLNKDERFAKTLVREIDGHRYELPPNDPRYVYPIPDEVIAFHPGMPQNTR